MIYQIGMLEEIEGDSGNLENDNDKVMAYLTLYNVILTYIKVLAPVIPFITDKIYQNLVRKVNNNAPDSIHLAKFLKFNESLVDEKLIWEIDSVKEVVSLGRSVRNKSNLKVRQPLSEVCIYFKSDNDYSIKDYNDQIIQELNVKKVNFIKSIEDIVEYKVKPNFALINQKYSDFKGDVISFINSQNSNYIIEKMTENKKISIDKLDIDLVFEDLIIEEIPKKDYCVISNNNAIVSINTKLDDALINEGIVRDIIRKNSKFQKGFVTKS